MTGFMLEASGYELEKTERAILGMLMELGKGAFDDEDITQKGRKLIIPEGMTLRQVVDTIRTKIRESERETYFERVYHYRPLDGAACMWRAMKNSFGTVGHRGKMGMFGEMAPEMRSIPIAYGKTEQVPWGRFSLPFLPDTLFETGVRVHDELGPLFLLTANGPKMFAASIEGVFKLVQNELEEASIYRGKAIDGQVDPDFIDLTGVDPAKVIFNDDVARQLEASLWGQLRYTEAMEKAGVPLKRAVLLHGPYGCGKTLAAGMTGQIAVENKWTYIKARPGRDNFLAVLQTARLYQPAVVFCEDVDTISDPSESEETITRLLDEFDGIEAKGTRIVCCLTSNHPERIQKGMLRPGRLDAVIEINSLDAGGVERMIKAVIDHELLDQQLDWDAIGQACDEFKPSFVREMADRAVRYKIVRGNGRTEGVLVTDDFVNAAVELRPQLDLMEGALESIQRDPISAEFGRIIEKAAERTIRDTVQEKLLVPAKNGS